LADSDRDKAPAWGGNPALQIQNIDPSKNRFTTGDAAGVFTEIL
jgi:hypothetical protein